MNIFEQADRYLDNGEGEKAMPLFHQLAAQGRVDAMHSIAHTHLYGLAGIPRDYDIAFKWFTKAASNGCPQAMYHLGMCNAKGYGTPVNPQKALEWYRKSADRGDEDAMYEVGNCYLHGIGSEPSADKAKEWFIKAAEYSQEQAAEMLRGL